jgi:iron complex outermembrane receptor protein
MHIGAKRPDEPALAWLSTLILISALVLPTQTAAASALSRPVVFDIAPQPLAAALERFADQADVQFTASGSLVGRLRTGGVHGRYAPTTALSMLLHHTGLGYKILGRRTIAIIARRDSVTGSAVTRRRISAVDPPQVGARPAWTGDVSKLATIIVTATKRAENVQAVPIAIDVVEGNKLAAQGVTTAGDIVKLFPNISAQGSTGIDQGVTIRGVGTSNIHLTGQESVGQYFDGVSAPTPFTSQVALFDLKRVEVLRGPQNTLFGKNTTGGAIRYISNTARVGKPANGYVRIGAGNYADINFTGAYGFPLSHSVAVRIAATAEHRAGIFKSLSNNIRYDSVSRQAGRVSLEWTPTRKTTVLVIAHVGASTGAPPPLKGVGPTLSDGVTPCSAIATGTNAYIGYNNCFQQSKTGALTNLSTDKWTDVYDVAPPIGAVHDSGGVVRVAHRFDDGISLTSITGLEHTSVQYAEDSAATPFMQMEFDQDGHYDFASQEFRLTSSGTGRFKWLAGIYTSYEYDDLGTTVINNGVGSPGSPPLALTTELKQLDRVVSIYARSDYEITKRLTLSVGGRFSYEDLSGTTTPRTFNFTQGGTLTGAELPPWTFVGLNFMRSMVAGVSTPCAAGVRGCNGPGIRQIQVTRLPGWNASLKYQVTPNIMAYVSNGRGFKSGSFDVRAVAVFTGSALSPVKPERIDATEAGVKTTLLHHHLRVNADVFHYRWLDQQAFSATLRSGPAFLNIPLSLVNGAELDVAAVLPDRWSFAGGMGFLHGWISQSGGLQGISDGAPLLNAPRFTGNATVGKAYRMGANGLLSLHASVRYQGSENSSLDGDPAEVVSPATFLDLDAEYTFGDKGQYQLTGLARNVTGTKTCGSNVFLGAPLGGRNGDYTCEAPNPGVPLYGVSFQMNFGR